MKEDKEQLILDTARKHFISKGFSGTRMQEIANEAGINKALLHYYFRSKDKLYKEVISQTLGKFIPEMAAALSSSGTFFERTEILVNTYIETITKNPELPLFIMSELTQNKAGFVAEMQKHASFFPAIFSFIQQMVTEMEAGKIRKIDPMQLMISILGMTIFPFMAKPVICKVFGKNEVQFDEMMFERKAFIVDFIKNALKKN